MSGTIHFQRLGVEPTALFDAAYALYAEVIEPSTQKSLAALVKMLANPAYHFIVATLEEDAGVPVGMAILYVSPRGAVALLEYLLVAAREQSRGVGGALFEYVAKVAHSLGALPLLIECEEADERDVTTIRRLRFYERLGCKRVAGLTYYLPLGDEAGAAHPMILLAHAPPTEHMNVVRKTTVQTWLETLYTEVYDRPQTDPRIARILEPLPEQVPLIA